jgi:hypothetical protein
VVPRRWWLAALPVAFGCVACAGLLSIDDVRYAASDGGADGPTGGDAGAGDADAAAPGPDAARPPTRLCKDHPLFFCDDFESVDFDSDWNQTADAGTVSLSALRANSGVQSLLAHTDVVDGGAQPPIALLGRSIAPTGPYYARLWVWFRSPVAGPGADPETFVSFDGDNVQGAELQVHHENAAHLTFSNYASTNTTKTSRAVFPVEQWTCVELLLNAAAQTAKIWVDGVEDTDLAAGGLLLGNLKYLELGLQFAVVGPAPAYDVWIDDFAIDPNRIGCD